MINKESGMSLITKTVTRLTAGLILIYAFYVVLKGHLGPGGGFAGGIIIALAFVHLMLAFGKEVALAKLDQAKGLFLCSLGALIFLCAFTSETLGFKVNPVIFMPLIDIAAALMVGTGLFIVFLALVLFVEGSLKR
ncbi:MAG: hypothetical protein NT033_10575 [Candidatus Omnitrophica bacterium]|nr:hypothetical protein [Candidatus Omnitrophota bacterium]